MSEEEFNNIISDLVINLEKAGVYDDNLKNTIDRLFELKQAIFIRDKLSEISQDRPSCRTCKFFENDYCTYISGLVKEGHIEIRGQMPNQERIQFKVNPFWYCKYFKA